MSIQMPKKRDEFIDLAVKKLQELANTSGYSKICKETLSFIVQKYVKLNKPPRFPKVSKKGFKFVKGDKK